MLVCFRSSNWYNISSIFFSGNPVFELSGTTANGGNTFIHINANANHWVLGGDNYTSQNLFVIKDGTPASSTHRFCINNSGNVGIGTVSPGQKLGVSGNIRFEAADPTLEFNNALVTHDLPLPVAPITQIFISLLSILMSLALLPIFLSL